MVQTVCTEESRSCACGMQLSWRQHGQESRCCSRLLIERVNSTFTKSVDHNSGVLITTHACRPYSRRPPAATRMPCHDWKGGDTRSADMHSHSQPVTGHCLLSVNQSRICPACPPWWHCTRAIHRVSARLGGRACQWGPGQYGSTNQRVNQSITQSTVMLTWQSKLCATVL